MADVVVDNTEARQQTSSIEAYSTYPFATDEEFQQGLSSLLAGGALEGQTSEEKSEILRRARVFYFNRKTGNNISIDLVRHYELNVLAQPAETASSNASQSEEPRILSFAELQELIQSGRVDEIPNNRVIPNILNDATPSESTAPARKKPWET